VNILTMPFDERLKLIRELSAITHICHADGCDREAVKICKSHPYPQYDWTDYDEAGFCEEHYGVGFDGQCDSCLPEVGCLDKYQQSSRDFMRFYSQQALASLASRIDENFGVQTGFKIGDTVNVSYPQRWRAS
jgi:hypothetical protein